MVLDEDEMNWNKENIPVYEENPTEHAEHSSEDAEIDSISDSEEFEDFEIESGVHFEENTMSDSKDDTNLDSRNCMKDLTTKSRSLSKDWLTDLRSESTRQVLAELKIHCSDETSSGDIKEAEMSDSSVTEELCDHFYAQKYNSIDDHSDSTISSCVKQSSTHAITDLDITLERNYATESAKLEKKNWVDKEWKTHHKKLHSNCWQRKVKRNYENRDSESQNNYDEDHNDELQPTQSKWHKLQLCKKFKFYYDDTDDSSENDDADDNDNDNTKRDCDTVEEFITPPLSTIPGIELEYRPEDLDLKNLTKT
ncbi:unnamed protein product [Thelazia callipaeda]|uniref:Protein phosphatase 1 regulatory subunit 15A n=1 Tax=Thelazia callipaeda TaxID=103827 RepID=A0A0N5CS52_THECL|nr:unnamed protein product [Thelazia callipaeda]